MGLLGVTAALLAWASKNCRSFGCAAVTGAFLGLGLGLGAGAGLLVRGQVCCRHPLLAEVRVELGSACGFRLGVEASGLCSFPRLQKAPQPPALARPCWSRLRFREPGWVVTAPAPVSCLDCVLTIATGALEQRSVAASAIF